MIIKIDDIEAPTNVICLSEARARFESGKCRHIHLAVDEDLAEVECKDCGAKLNPISVLVRLAREESRFEQRRLAMVAEREKLEVKSRTKCQHCGKMTHVRAGR